MASSGKGISKVEPSKEEYRVCVGHGKGLFGV